MKPSRKRLTSSGNTPEFREKSPFGRALRKRVQNFIKEASFLPKGNRILVALSGGPDSTALFHILLSLRKRLELELFAAHVNYRLRGKDSDADEHLVRELCKRYGIPLSISHTKGSAGKNEEALRNIRYQFFKQIQGKTNCKFVAVAHNRDDQGETVLLRLLRGAGTEGLRAMMPRRDTVIRPLLETSREDILRYLKEEHIPFRIDKSNRDTTILRNRIRQRLIPLLERDYQPNIRTVLARTARVLGTRSTEKLALPLTLDQISFSRKEFLALDETRQVETLRSLAKDASPERKYPSEAFVREARKAIRSVKGKIRIVYSERLKITARGDRVILVRNK